MFGRTPTSSAFRCRNRDIGERVKPTEPDIRNLHHIIPKNTSQLVSIATGWFQKHGRKDCRKASINGWGFLNMPPESNSRIDTFGYLWKPCARSSVPGRNTSRRKLRWNLESRWIGSPGDVPMSKALGRCPYLWMGVAPQEILVKTPRLRLWWNWV